MWWRLLGRHPECMTTLMDRTETTVTPPLSAQIRVGCGLALAIGGLLNGGVQYVMYLYSGDPDDYIRWGAEHPVAIQTEQLLLLVSMLLLPLGLLGMAQVSRWHAPRLTAVATVLFLWGMWGFHNVLGLWYAAGSVAPDALGADAAVRLDGAYSADPGVVATALAPHLAGSFVGIMLLCVAARRAFPVPALVLLAVFLVWDFTLAPVGPLEPHLLLAVALCWLGVHLMRMSPETWRGATP